MYMRQQVQKNENKIAQTIDFFSLRKKNLQVVASLSQDKITLNKNHQGTILSVLGIFQLSSSVLINEQIFQNFSIQCIPKAFQAFVQQQTLKSILKIILDRTQSICCLIDLINQYPITTFIIECYCRMVGLNYIKKNKIQEYGNQEELIEDYNVQIRGFLLGVVADAMNTQIMLSFADIRETYGKDKNQRKIIVTYTHGQYTAEIHNKKNIPHNRPLLNRAIKQSAIKQIDSQDNCFTGQNNNNSDQLTNSQTMRCQKCKMSKKKCCCTSKINSYLYSSTPRHDNKFQKTISTINLSNNFSSQTQGNLNKFESK